MLRIKSECRVSSPHYRYVTLHSYVGCMQLQRIFDCVSASQIHRRTAYSSRNSAASPFSLSCSTNTTILQRRDQSFTILSVKGAKSESTGGPHGDAIRCWYYGNPDSDCSKRSIVALMRGVQCGRSRLLDLSLTIFDVDDRPLSAGREHETEAESISGDGLEICLSNRIAYTITSWSGG